MDSLANKSVSLGHSLRRPHVTTPPSSFFPCDTLIRENQSERHSGRNTGQRVLAPASESGVWITAQFGNKGLRSTSRSYDRHVWGAFVVVCNIIDTSGVQGECPSLTHFLFASTHHRDWSSSTTTNSLTLRRRETGGGSCL